MENIPGARAVFLKKRKKGLWPKGRGSPIDEEGGRGEGKKRVAA